MIVVKNPQELKELLTSDGNTITATAKYCRCSKAYISSIVTGTRNPNEKVSIKICELTGKKFDDIFFIRNVNKLITNQSTTT